jgi:DUF4097 and DUF4098 domain-containing protein YvlB
MNVTIPMMCGVLALGTPALAQDLPDFNALAQQLNEQVREEIRAMQQSGIFDHGQKALDSVLESLQVERDKGSKQRDKLAREVDKLQRRGAATGPEYTDNFSRTVRLGRTGTFELSNVAGDVTITGGSGDDVRIQAVKRVRRVNESEAKTLLAEIEIRVSERPGMVVVETEQSRRRRDVAAAVDFTIAVPSGASVAVRSVSGVLRVSNVRGELRAESVSGDVNLSSVGRLRTVKSVSGDLEVSDVDGEDVVASSVSGDVMLRNLKARSLDLQTVSGDMRFADLQTDRVTLKTISGDIDFGGRLARGGRYDFQSHSGDVRITPTGNPAFDLEASTFSGDVHSDFALTLRGATVDQGNGFNAGPGRGPRLNRTIRGSIGDGGALISIRSFSGDVVIVKR